MQQIALSSIENSLIDEISSSRNEPKWLKEYRNSSLSIYQELPHEVSPLYNKYTDAKRMNPCLLYTSPSPRDRQKSRMPSSA